MATGELRVSEGVSRAFRSSATARACSLVPMSCSSPWPAPQSCDAADALGMCQNAGGAENGGFLLGFPVKQGRNTTKNRAVTNINVLRKTDLNGKLLGYPCKQGFGWEKYIECSPHTQETGGECVASSFPRPFAGTNLRIHSRARQSIGQAR